MRSRVLGHVIVWNVPASQDILVGGVEYFYCLRRFVYPGLGLLTLRVRCWVVIPSTALNLDPDGLVLNLGPDGFEVAVESPIAE